MKTVTLTQATKQHIANRLHDQFVAAGLVPTLVESDATESRFTFQDAAGDAAIQTVITNYVYVAPAIPGDLVAMGTAYKNAVNALPNSATKTILNNELWVILKHLALRDVNLV